MLDGSFRLLRVNIRSLLILTALFVVPLQLLASFFQRDLLSVGFLSLLNDPLAAQGVADESVWSSVLAGGIGFLTAGFVLPLVTGGVCRLIGSSYLGEQSDHDAALRVAGRRAGALLGTWWLHLLILLVPLLPGVALLALAAAADSVGAAVLGVVVLLGGAVGMLLLVPLFVAAAPAVVIEHLGPVAALRRSRQLIRARYWPTLGVVVVTGLIFSTISSILASPFSLVGQLVGGSFAWVLVALGAIVGQLVSVPLTGIVATLVYFDGRIRTEGFDLQLLARSLGDPSPSADGWGGGR